MRLVIDVTPGDFTTPADLAAHAGNIRAVVDLAIAGVAQNDYPEFVFGPVEILPDAEPATPDAGSPHGYPDYTFPVTRRTRY